MCGVDRGLGVADTGNFLDASLQIRAFGRYGPAVATTYRAGQVASLLGVSPDTVRRWADSGRLRDAPHARAGSA